MIFAASKALSVLVLGKGAFHILKGLCFVIKHMDKGRREYGLLGSVTHTEHLVIGAPLFADLLHSLRLFGVVRCFFCREQLRCLGFGNVGGYRHVRLFCFFGCEIKLIYTHVVVFHDKKSFLFKLFFLNFVFSFICSLFQ